MSRVEALREFSGTKGYAFAFQPLVTHIMKQLPANEEIREALRKTLPVYPDIAVRELVANALVHQDLTLRGSGPLIEIFADRIEITNPGIPLVEPQRFIDAPPQSRNDTLAALMRRFGICEERGSGVDKVIFHVEAYQLPPPDFEVSGQSHQGNSVCSSQAQTNDFDREGAGVLSACLLTTCLKCRNDKFDPSASDLG
jgi:predicted HTH transcriptional regulator